MKDITVYFDVKNDRTSINPYTTFYKIKNHKIINDTSYNPVLKIEKLDGSTHYINFNKILYYSYEEHNEGN